MNRKLIISGSIAAGSLVGIFVMPRATIHSFPLIDWAETVLLLGLIISGTVSAILTVLAWKRLTVAQRILPNAPGFAAILIFLIYALGTSVISVESIYLGDEEEIFVEISFGGKVAFLQLKQGEARRISSGTATNELVVKWGPGNEPDHQAQWDVSKDVPYLGRDKHLLITFFDDRVEYSVRRR